LSVTVELRLEKRIVTLMDERFIARRNLFGTKRLAFYLRLIRRASIPAQSGGRFAP